MADYNAIMIFTIQYSNVDHARLQRVNTGDTWVCRLNLWVHIYRVQVQKDLVRAIPRGIAMHERT